MPGPQQSPEHLPSVSNMLSSACVVGGSGDRGDPRDPDLSPAACWSFTHFVV